MFAALLVMLHRRFCGHTQRGDMRHRKGARTQPAFLATAVEQRLEWWTVVASPTEDQSADAFGGVNLVPAHGNQVDPTLAQGFDVLPKRLRGVGVKKSIVSFQDR